MSACKFKFLDFFGCHIPFMNASGVARNATIPAGRGPAGIEGVVRKVSGSR